MAVIFTKHAERKFKILEKHQFPISRELVLLTVKHPEILDWSRRPLIIAQRRIDKAHVLRVVYRKQSSFIFVITFYPGRTKQYL